MRMSKSAKRKARRYDREKYFSYLDALLDENDSKAFAREVRLSIESPRGLSLLDYVRERRTSKERDMTARAAAFIWEREVRAHMPKQTGRAHKRRAISTQSLCCA